MAQLQLTDEQAQELGAMLNRVLGDLSYEISDTDTQDFRDQLKHRRDVLRSVADLLAPEHV